jgi:hypothetical protein
LAAVTVVILISICKMVFQLFVRYTVKHDKWRIRLVTYHLRVLCLASFLRGVGETIITP